MKRDHHSAKQWRNDDDRNAKLTEPPPRHEPNYEWPDEVELLFYRKRP